MDIDNHEESDSFNCQESSNNACFPNIIKKSDFFLNSISSEPFLNLKKRSLSPDDASSNKKSK